MLGIRKLSHQIIRIQFTNTKEVAWVHQLKWNGILGEIELVDPQYKVVIHGVARVEMDLLKVDWDM
jgi:hypothetical protein